MYKCQTKLERLETCCVSKKRLPPTALLEYKKELIQRL